MSGFQSLGLCDSLVSCCTALGWDDPLPIQLSAIPPALNGKDVIGTSETGSGKTAAFMLPILQNWLNCGRPKGFALILSPTRELALQTADTATTIMNNFTEENGKVENPLNVFLLTGGEKAADQAIALAWCRHHFLVATPGRLAEHIRQSTGFAHHHLATIKQLVLDEADRMLSLEFGDDLDLLLSFFQRSSDSGGVRSKSRTFLEKRAKDMPEAESLKTKGNVVISSKFVKFPHPQTYLFTATLNKDMRNLRRVVLRKDAVLCTATGVIEHSLSKPQSLNVDLPKGLRHYCLPTRRADKLACLEWLLESRGSGIKALVFCARCHETRFVAGFLVERGFRAVGLTGRMKQPERRRVLAEFVAAKVDILVATDVASRGLDLPFVDLVINYGVPLTAKSYRHRVGRTARAGRCGTAVTIVTRDDGKAYLELEASLLPTGPGEPRRCIPRWLHPLPPEKTKSSEGEIGMEKRRRLAQEAWSRAAKAIREEEVRRLEEKDKEEESSSEFTECEDDDFDNNVDWENQHWASGAAGIAAYCEAMRRRKKLHGREGNGEEDGEGSGGDSEDAEERGNLHFDQTIKQRRGAKRKRNQKNFR